MSDDAYSRSSRPIPPHGDAAERREPSSDPLMELARLIGQSDPFGTPPGRGTDSPSLRAPELPTRGPMARPPSRDVSARDISPRDIAPRTERHEEKLRHEEPRYEDEQPYEPRPARGHPFPWLQVPPEPAPAVSREPSHSDRSHEQAREAAYRETAYREPPPYSEPPLSEAPAAHPSYGQPAPGGYERYEPTLRRCRSGGPAARPARLRGGYLSDRPGSAVCRAALCGRARARGSLSAPRRPPALRGQSAGWPKRASRA